VKITKVYTLEAANAFQTLGTEEEPFNFVFVSGSGATTEPGKFSQVFARVKGETERELAELRRANPTFHASSVRPGFVDAAAHEAIKPYLPKPPVAISILQTLMGPPIRVGLKSLWSPTAPLGQFMAEMAMGKYKDQLVAGKDIQMIGEFPILENSAFRRLAGL
jgi:hypothetical protein